MALAGGIGLSGLTGGPVNILMLSAASLVAWAAWALLTFMIGVHILPEPQTRADVGQLLRTIGFAATPGRDLPQLRDAIDGEPSSPRPDRSSAHPDLLRDPRVGHPITGQQQHPCPQHLPMRRRLRPSQPGQDLPITIGKGQWIRGCLHTQILPNMTFAILETLH